LISYLISDPSFYTSKVDTFSTKLESVYLINKNNITMACLRDKSFTNFDLLSKIFIKTSHKFHIKSIIHSSIDIAYSLDAYGVHLSSSNISLTKEAKEKDLYTICSTHNIDEVYKAYELGADVITYSPIFCDKYTKAKTIDGLKEILQENLPIKILALGGVISQEHIKLLSDIGVDGFASIRYFINKLNKSG
jgi:thiamine-phosphate pyrophosphorylase